LGLSPFTVRRYIQSRKLKAVKLEGSYRVRQSHLDGFIHAREIETEEELAELEKNATPTDKPHKIVEPIRKPRAAPPVRESKRKPKTRATPRRREEE